jgi:hypothetical protein
MRMLRRCTVEEGGQEEEGWGANGEDVAGMEEAEGSGERGTTAEQRRRKSEARATRETKGEEERMPGWREDELGGGAEMRRTTWERRAVVAGGTVAQI